MRLILLLFFCVALLAKSPKLSSEDDFELNGFLFPKNSSIFLNKNGSVSRIQISQDFKISESLPFTWLKGTTFYFEDSPKGLINIFPTSVKTRKGQKIFSIDLDSSCELKIITLEEITETSSVLDFDSFEGRCTKKISNGSKYIPADTNFIIHKNGNVEVLD
ncbi:MAG: hypothetical protein SFU98_04900 [Leptospiraceae bacterium]|nr:hypothetical protein [Leptospiraceae bacterium]